MQTRNLTVLTFAITLLLVLTGCSGNRQAGTDRHGQGLDTIYTEAKAMSIHLSKPEHAMQLIDSAVIVGNISWQRGQYLKAITQYGGLHNFVLSRQTCLDLLDTSNPKSLVSNLKTRNDSDDLQSVYALLVCVERGLNHDAAVIRYATEAAKLDHALNLPGQAANMEGNIAEVMARTGKTDEGISRLQTLIDELRKKDDFNYMTFYHNTSMSLLHILLNHKRYAEIVPACESMLQRINEFSEHTDRFEHLPKDFDPKEFEDFARGQTLAFLTTAYARQYTSADRGELAPAAQAELLSKARRAEAEMFKTNWSHTIDCDRMMTAAYHHLGEFQRFDEAMARLDESMGDDTLSYNFLTGLGLRATAAKMRGRWAEAVSLQDRLFTIRDSLDNRNQRDKLNELATVYHLQEERFARQEAENDAHLMKLYLLFIGVALLAAIAFAAYFFYKRRQTNQKNRVLAREIAEAIKYKEMWEQTTAAQTVQEATLSSSEGGIIAPATKTIERLRVGEQSSGMAPSGAVEGASGASEASDLYMRLREVILREQLYLDPRLDRQALVERFGLSKERIGAAFAKGSPFKSLIDFLTDCRLPYAAKLLAEHPELSIADVAHASGFPSADTFGRNFKQKYALTPSQFREQQELI